MKEIMEPYEVAESAESQLLSLKKAEEDKIQKVKEEQKRMVALKRTLSALVYAAGSGYSSVYQQAEGFIEGRIKTLDSVEIKTRNEITEILNKIEENPQIDQQDILDKISKIDFKDLFAFSIVTNTTPKEFKTGSDEKNKEFRNLSFEIETSKKRIDEHKDFIDFNNTDIKEIRREIEELKEQKGLITEKEKKEKIETKKKEIIAKSKELESEELEKLLNELESLSKVETQETINKIIAEKTKLIGKKKINISYGEKNLERTESVFKKALRDLQYKMSDYYVSNLSKFSIFKFWGTESIRTPKQIVKPGFRATNTGYKVKFSNKDNDKETVIKFEAQGKGGLDYKDAEFSTIGAEYHEEQKTKDGIISKNIVMPDFTIIGRDKTNKIETEIRSQYADITSVDDLEEIGKEKEAELLRKFERDVIDEVKKGNLKKCFTKKEIAKKIEEAFCATKESIIQQEIEKQIANEIDIMASDPELEEKIGKDNNLKAIFEEERKKICSTNRSNNAEKIDHLAKIRVLYREKENEINQYAQTSIPRFFRANLPKKGDEEIIVYWYTTGESIYRYFVNKLNGLKDEKGNYKYEPQEQQRRALLKLTGLFEENPENFYTYENNSNRLKTLREER